MAADLRNCCDNNVLLRTDSVASVLSLCVIKSWSSRDKILAERMKHSSKIVDFFFLTTMNFGIIQIRHGRLNE